MLTLVLLSQNPTNAFEWMVFLANKYSHLFLQGMWITLYVAILGTIGGFMLGFLIGIIEDIKISQDDGAVKKIMIRILKAVCKIYVELFRGTPMIVQAMIIFYGICQTGVQISPDLAGIIVTLVNTGAYMAETVRAGINSVDAGQKEGALSLGMSPLGAMQMVVLPQAFKNIIPEMANTFLTNLKMTSVLNVIGVSELFMMAKTAGGTYYKYFEAYLIFALIFWFCVSFSTVFSNSLKIKCLSGKTMHWP